MVLRRSQAAQLRADHFVVETFPRGGAAYMVCYPFEGGRHQTLGMLLTR